ncbi:DNA gyrase inhibitor YacG [uncultured Ferrovibrio sp.]|uniref:DNA gyrase inhibitor YacG n=1 Tax=uncultured Ferrovibrio sp. TaxID=1576913 RepID=UPI00262D6174|nr:DNA gyrase inhibitor YacG [uncultured Ferrovibrio sp.]
MTAKTCPICGKPSVPQHTPFCSGRCADVDLHRWLKGSYSIPAIETDDPDEEDTDPQTSDRLH